MLKSVNPLERVAAGRLIEFLSERTPWHRSLWSVGVILAMEELYEACAAMRQGHLSEGAVRRMASSLQKRVGMHPCFQEHEKHFLREQVKQVPRADGAAHFGIRDLAVRVGSDYLRRWGRAISAGQVSVELFARSVSAHLLDEGFAGEHLHAFIKGKLDAPEEITLPELCHELQHEISANPRREFEVLMAFVAIPSLRTGVPQTWLRGAAVTNWLKTEGFDTAGVRAPAAIVLKVLAKDPIGAAQAARDEAERYMARALIATGEPLKLAPMLWVKGASLPAPMRGTARGVDVKELAREGRIFATADTSQSVDAAFELLAHLEASSPPAAVAGGWGAIEGLLADPDDRASAADNLATLVTCSFPRAELTALSYRLQRQSPGIYRALEDETTNRKRAIIVAKMILDREMPEMEAMADRAAIDRLKKLLADPRGSLQTIREAVGDSFHRLYRQRNLILHGARLDSVALAASLRTVAKLAGAGMDRITHGRYVQNLQPLELVARGNLALAVVDRGAPLQCAELLEQ